MAKNNVYEWHNKFEAGRNSVQDDHRTGRPKSVISKYAILAALDMVNKCRHVTIREVVEHLDMSVGSAHTLFTEELNMNRVCAHGAK